MYFTYIKIAIVASFYAGYMIRPTSQVILLYVWEFRRQTGATSAYYAEDYRILDQDKFMHTKTNH
jgi:hypothetical protein